MSLQSLSFHPSTEMLSNRTLLTLKGRRVPPNTPPSLPGPADQAQIGLPLDTSSVDHDEEHEIQDEVQPSCQHQPCETFEIVQAEANVCDTCKVINYVILAVESHRLTIQASATSHLHEARKDLLDLILNKMQNNASQTCRRPSTSASDDLDNDTDPKSDAKDQEFRKLNRMFQRGCKKLGLDSDDIWKSFIERKEQVGGETERTRLRRELEFAGLGREFLDFDFGIGEDGDLDIGIDMDASDAETVPDNAGDGKDKDRDNEDSIKDDDDFDMLEDVV